MIHQDAPQEPTAFSSPFAELAKLAVEQQQARLEREQELRRSEQAFMESFSVVARAGIQPLPVAPPSTD
jgi:hypothetical protein